MPVSKDYLESVADDVKKQLPEGHAIILLVCEYKSTRDDNEKYYQSASNLLNREDFIKVLKEFIKKLETDLDNEKNNRWFRK